MVGSLNYYINFRESKKAWQSSITMAIKDFKAANYGNFV